MPGGKPKELNRPQTSNLANTEKLVGSVANGIVSLDPSEIHMRRRLPTRIYFRLTALALCGIAIPGAIAQDNVKELFGVAQERNARELRNLEWNSRTEVLVDGKSAGVRIDKVQFDSSGRIQRTLFEPKRNRATRRKGPS